MGRTRVIDRDLLLDAAEVVVARDGAAKLTLESVAAQAGVSKASVVYDHKTKQALIGALVTRALERDNAFNHAAAEQLGDVDARVVRGRIVAAADPLPPQQRAVALTLCAALAQDVSLRQAMQANQAAVIDALQRDAAEPRNALLAYLALEGLKLLESLDFHTFPTAERDRLLREIGGLVDGMPPAPAQASAKRRR
ncbi:TetR family transcriptional regulator [Piscinibacter gummiphilus]|uniref:TetR family transcriptional regulator n=1 Tax=Piscinibacter gummiphilus TaxID=946333 RepID=A0A1W6L904_9BURK|nr:TetR family transcriptional regulator [Piscinibacter gummiphilus]ARN20648.1 TetR family transcriptional regulator [Piscinibacter gummiphilus]ATU65325.1 TetR family transcriptional regulator [Piscinibacter gummiphilus]GLS94467.1 TetR family transcriptional regulator [Piscinibacter gummiphilus]